MFGEDLAKKIDKQLRKKMDIMFEFEFNGLLLFSGNALKKMMMGNKIDVYNFILLTLEKNNVIDFFQKNNLKYKKISDSEFDFIYNKVKASLVIMDDLINGVALSSDFLFYDIHRKQFIPVGIKYSVRDKKIYDMSYVNPSNCYGEKEFKEKEEVGKKFVQFLRGDSKKIRVVRKNKFRNFFKKF